MCDVCGVANMGCDRPEEKPPVNSLVKPSVFYFGSQNVGHRPINKGLLYMDSRDKVARVNDHFEGLVVLDWQDTGKQSQCSEKHFRRRFYLYGNGHSV